jgi:hypothetical protein
MSSATNRKIRFKASAATLRVRRSGSALAYGMARCQPEAQSGTRVAFDQAEASGKCPHCGVKNDQIPFGCDKLGHKAAGVGAFLDWWPVKAWGPCQKAAEAGLPYTRKGQSLDETLFGGRPRN